jgi:TonB family protein
MNFRYLLLLWCLVAPVAMARASDSLKPIDFEAEVKVTLDAMGKPTLVEVPGQIPEAVRSYIQNTVSGWRFEMPKPDDVVVESGVTYLNLEIHAIPASGGYRLEVGFVGNGPGTGNLDGELVPPRYPQNAARMGAEASMDATYVVEVDGSVTLESLRFARGSSKEKSIELTVKNWVNQLHYLPEMVNGVPVQTRIKMPVDFRLTDGSRLGRTQKDAEVESRFKLLSQGN